MVTLETELNSRDCGVRLRAPAYKATVIPYDFLLFK